VDLLNGAARAIAALACAFALCVQAQGVTEPAVKAAFLYKFAGYVEWPAPAATPEGPFVIGVREADEVRAELARLLPGRSINGRPAVVRAVREGEPMQGVHILFVGSREPDPRAVVRAAQQRGILTVTESGLDAGAAINFVVAENRVAFEVSLEAAERGGHRISSRMLAVARRVVPKAAS
jgi:hypothetical protein